MNEQENFDCENVLDEQADLISSLPKPTLKLLDFKRYREMLQCACDLRHSAEEALSDKSIAVDIDRYFNLGCVRVEIPDLSVTDPQRFAAAVSKADNFEIYPLTNGNLRLDITFHNVMQCYYGEEYQ